MNNKKNIVTDQELFFNHYSENENIEVKNDFFFQYAAKEQKNGFKWLSDKKNILDYGCGTGGSIDIFLRYVKNKKFIIYGVDIAEMALKRAQKKYPKYKFYRIQNNKISQIKDSSMDGAYMMHVLHHSTGHKKMFKEIYAKLNHGGKFLINDLSSNNPINKLGRSAFVHLPKFAKNKFDDDLVVGESIPEKYKVHIDEVVRQLKEVGFNVEKVEYGHLFFFVFGWIDRFIPLEKYSIIRMFYKKLIDLENSLLEKKSFQGGAELFCVRAVKE